MINITVPINIESSSDCFVETFFYNKEDMMAVQNRPLIIICPGGGYNHLSVREGESIAFQFNAMGYHSAVLHYSVSPATYPTQLLELATCFKYFKDNASQYAIDDNNILVFGASAGAHLASLFGTGYFRKEVTDILNVSSDYLRPTGLVLAYPVITSGEFAHRGSFDKLIGEHGDKSLNNYLSIENRIDEHTPPCFIWHTCEDKTVPLENSVILISALRKVSVPFEYHVFPSGCHGLALANELTLSNDKKENNPAASVWVSLCHTWLKNLCGPLV